MKMKKIMTLTITIAFLFVMVVSLAGCGGDTSTPSEPASTSGTSSNLVNVTSAEGISLKIPSEWVLQNNGVYIDKQTGENVAFDVVDAAGNQISSYTEETVLNTYQGTYKNVVVRSFKNGLQLNGKEALQTQITLTTPEGDDFTLTLVIVTDGTKNYLINFTNESSNTDGTLAQNLQACIDSITIK